MVFCVFFAKFISFFRTNANLCAACISSRPIFATETLWQTLEETGKEIKKEGLNLLNAFDMAFHIWNVVYVVFFVVNQNAGDDKRDKHHHNEHNEQNFEDFFVFHGFIIAFCANFVKQREKL